MAAAPEEPRSKLDTIGACASTVCAVHCAVTGVAFGLITVGWLGFLDSPWLDVGLLFLAIGIGIAAGWHGIRRHGSYRPAAFFALGLLLIVIGHFALHEQQTRAVSGAVSAAGGACLVTFHILNLRSQRCKNAPPS